MFGSIFRPFQVQIALLEIKAGLWMVNGALHHPQLCRNEWRGVRWRRIYLKIPLCGPPLPPTCFHDQLTCFASDSRLFHVWLMEFHCLTWALVRWRKGTFSHLCAQLIIKSIKNIVCELELCNSNTREECLFAIMTLILSIMESVCNVHSSVVCEVIWRVGGCSRVLGTALVMQSDNSRKEVCVLALACTPKEKQSVAARAARFCQRLGSRCLAEPDLWLN